MAARLALGLDCRPLAPRRPGLARLAQPRGSPHALGRGRRGIGPARAAGDGEQPQPDPSSKPPDVPSEQQQQPSSGGRQRRQRRRQSIGGEREGLSLDTFNPIAMGRGAREVFDDVMGKKQGEGLTLEDFNPIAMGRRSREVFDDVWAQLQRIGSPTRSVLEYDETFRALETPEEFEAPAAPNTTVLVTGATGRVGRVLVRKLLLRGYRVRALVRVRSAPGEDAIPQKVEQVVGDVTNYQDCRKAVEGVDKVICCSAARSSMTADLTRIDDRGVANLARALQDRWNKSARQKSQVPSKSKITVADFSRAEFYRRWDMEHVGVPAELEEATVAAGRGSRRRPAVKQVQQDVAEAYINTANNLTFEGQLRSRNAYAEVGAPVAELPFGATLAGTEGLVVRLAGDGNQYSVGLRTVSGQTYTAKLPSTTSYSEARLPYHVFVPSAPGLPPLDPADVVHLTVRFDQPRTRQADAVVEAGSQDGRPTNFHLEVDWIKALPGGIEADFILVSCAGRRPDMDELAQERLQKAKQSGESALRSSGLGYVVVRPGPLLEEAGGYKALVFDQSRRITQGIACADVADVCLKALHDPLARNKSFEVCWEYTPEAGLEAYELVAHLPDKANNYLSPVLATLQKNT